MRFIAARIRSRSSGRGSSRGLAGGNAGAVVLVCLLAELHCSDAEPVADRLGNVPYPHFQGGGAAADLGGLGVGAGVSASLTFTSIVSQMSPLLPI
jgi:hypothetical protein